MQQIGARGTLILARAQYQGGVGLAGAEGGHFLIIIKPTLLY